MVREGGRDTGRQRGGRVVTDGRKKTGKTEHTRREGGDTWREAGIETNGTPWKAILWRDAPRITPSDSERGRKDGGRECTKMSQTGGIILT